ncbi:rhamnan synthesis F family protein [Paenibacillus polysaccharolyticus]|uniref:rhamnan synthesis F family protein n=1 Tax=Paenibacillus polysaccharolyticus TaxID=582692 RepID=UPI00209D3459|nr:rhamnan synthesis F family protein [Paenibacillus polysaccharolyticus]MCP1137543.1 rhamnan synthesis F family protein [Paenibacillus polysaccharolyticus]
MILSKSSKRLGIFFFYDDAGIVDDYVTYLLNDIKIHLNRLIIVCNGKITPDGRMKLERLTEDLIVRENKGYDVWAYKEGIEYLGWEHIFQYDEMILFNSTMYGPLESFNDMFRDMEGEDLDFWGITKFHKVNYDPFGTIKYGYIPEHIQSHFIAVRNKMLTSSEFQKYWNNMRPVNSYLEAIGFHEAIFTKEFSDKGYTWNTYVNTSDLEGYTYHPILMMPLELIKNRKCPIIKRRSFFHDLSDFLNNTTGEQTMEAYEYIQANLPYDTSMIWDNILRTNNQADIKNSMNHNFILSSKSSNGNSHTSKVALVLHIYFEDKISYCLNYAKSMPPETDVYVTTGSEANKKLILEEFKTLKCSKLEVIVIKNRGRDVSSLLVGVRQYLMNYDYVCFAHDKKTKQLHPYVKGESFSYKCFENTLKNRHFVNNIIETFNENPRLGILSPPPPNHADFYFTIGNEWSINLDNTKKLSEKLNLTVDMVGHKEPISPLGTMFWFRPQALKTLLEYEWKYEDFPEEPNNVDGTMLHAIERIYPYISQQEGYFPAWVMVDTFARIETTNLYYMLRQINRAYFSKFGPTAHYEMVSNIIKSVKVSRKYQTKQILKRYLPPIAIDMLKKFKKLVR